MNAEHGTRMDGVGGRFESKRCRRSRVVEWGEIMFNVGVGLLVVRPNRVFEILGFVFAYTEVTPTTKKIQNSGTPLP